MSRSWPRRSLLDFRLVDLLLADLLADLALLGHGLGAEPDALDRDGFLFHHGPFGAEGDLVFFLADVWTGQGRIAVFLGDRLALDPDLFVADRDRRGHVLGHHVLAQSHPPGRHALGAHVQPLLRAGHRIISGGTGHVAAFRARRADGIGALAGARAGEVASPS